MAVAPPAPGATVGVAIRAWNAAPTLARAIETALAQTRKPDEIVVVDDGSSDATADIAQSFPNVRLVRHDVNRGGAAALQTAVESARCDWIAFLDADDGWRADKLERQMALLAAEPGAVMAGCAYARILEDGRRQPQYVEPFAHAGADFWRNQLRSSAILLSSAVARRDAALAALPLDPAMKTGHDQALLVRIAAQGAVVFDHEMLVDYNLLPTGISRTRSPASSLRVLQMHLDHIDLFRDRLAPAERRALIARRNGEAANDLVSARAWGPGLMTTARAILGGDRPRTHLSRVLANLPLLRRR